MTIGAVAVPLRIQFRNLGCCNISTSVKFKLPNVHRQSIRNQSSSYNKAVEVENKIADGEHVEF